MTDRTSPHVVLGATGGAGRAVVHELVHRGLPVRAVSRSGGHPFPEGIERRSADCMDPEAARTACRNASVVYHCINLPYSQWTAWLPMLAENCIAAASQAEAPLVVMDNLYLYGRPNGAMTENTPRDPTGPKGEVRAEVERVFLEAHEKGQYRWRLGERLTSTARTRTLLLAISSSSPHSKGPRLRGWGPSLPPTRCRIFETWDEVS